jgi:NTP pyrophosphatase (non-canonical NTP hydrolase)
MVIERARQDEKWGEQNHPDEYWLGIVMEEIGEVAKAVIEADDKSLTSEVIHSVAVLCGWMESRNRRALGTVVTA